MQPNRLRLFTPGAIHHFPYDIRGLRVGENCWNQISRRLSWCPATCSRNAGHQGAVDNPRHRRAFCRGTPCTGFRRYSLCCVLVEAIVDPLWGC